MTEKQQSLRLVIISLLVIGMSVYIVYTTLTAPSPFMVDIRKNAEQGDADAQFVLGLFYYNQGNFEEAVKWYQKAAEQNNPAALNSLASCYRDGKGVPVDREKADELLRLSFDQGNRAGASPQAQLETRQIFEDWRARQNTNNEHPSDENDNEENIEIENE